MTSHKWGGPRVGAGRTPLKECDKKKGVKIYITDCVKEDILQYGFGKSFSEKALEILTSEIYRRKNIKSNK